MDTNEEILRIHSEILKKITEICELSGSSRKAVEVGNDIISYGKAWSESFADDGRISIEEAANISEAASDLVNKYIPNKTFRWYNPVSWIISGFCNNLRKRIREIK